ncbi:TrmH family RNA methyltransferase [Tenacibaculum xiamenense]|uniref:TrmH family RNA methyltransferase n=1 Tax=Tenacibaculum xiamenense TaxID=1261553 RepID=UPI003893607D
MTENFELIAVLENPNFIINIGSVIRNIHGLGVDKLFVIDGQKRLEDNLEELRKRKSLLKHSNGAVKWTNIKVFTETETCFDFLNKNGFISVGTSPHNICKKQVKLTESNLVAPKLAIWFGEESKGLSETAARMCEYCLTIDMKGKVESFNLSTTTGIVMYEAIKQREKK